LFLPEAVTQLLKTMNLEILDGKTYCRDHKDWASDGAQSVLGTHHFGSATLDATCVHFSDQAASYTP
jgi:hypothetical protein